MIARGEQGPPLVNVVDMAMFYYKSTDDDVLMNLWTML